MIELRKPPIPRQVAGVLMLISGVTHVVQLYFYPENHSAWGASIFGAIYFALGVYLLRSSTRAALWLTAILPSIGGALGVWRFLHLHRNPFSVFHVAVDLVVVPCCIYMLMRKAGDTN
ncbi:MAG: hypothetical protein IT367_03960 [Candidatus Hydrogenedentes bacterium]|nr:hypothetical protein [Candidatus Hydrogenedentota bacterium]